jgi:hypothetical protein
MYLSSAPIGKDIQTFNEIVGARLVEIRWINTVNDLIDLVVVGIEYLAPHCVPLKKYAAGYTRGIKERSFCLV